MRVALYARVSASDKDQNPEIQLLLLRREAERRRHHIEEYVDEESGGTSKRKAFRALMRNAGKRRFDLARVFALDRFSSEGIEAVFEHTATLEQAGATFWRHCEPALNTIGPEYHRPYGQPIQSHHRLGCWLPQLAPLQKCAPGPGTEACPGGSCRRAVPARPPAYR